MGARTILPGRRVAAASSAVSIKLPSPAPAVVPVSAAATATSQRSRLSQQVQLRNSPAARGRRVATSMGPDADEDAEGEDDMEEDTMEEGGDTEDKELYCFCRKLSYGEVRRHLTLPLSTPSFGFCLLCILTNTLRGRRKQLLESDCPPQYHVCTTCCGGSARQE